MKYNYKRSIIFLQWLTLALSYVIMIGFVYLLGANEKFLKKAILGAVGFFVIMVTTYSKEFLNRYVELHNNYVHLNSFRFKDVRQKNALSFNIKYEDIFSIEAKMLPLIGVVGIKITARNLPKKLTITASISKHKDLFKKICIYAKDYNPKVYIDEKLEKYIGDGGNE